MLVDSCQFFFAFLMQLVEYPKIWSKFVGSDVAKT